LESRYKSFVGMHEVPVVYGMTIGEYGKMVKGEGWNGTSGCKLSVIPNDNYDHMTFYELPTRPSPNLPNMTSIYLYPSLCFFEGTVVSLGRGTDKPFQIAGHPDYIKGKFQFVPKGVPGSTSPVLMNRTCTGIDLSEMRKEKLQKLEKIDLAYLIDFYQTLPEKKNFFNNYFNVLAGTGTLKQQIIENLSEAEIQRSWAFEQEKFKKIREKYLLYRDFESRIDVK
ncbi:MAG TPA: exo-beta-N-acetylmuramidase NamZ domain-containing protein, partial [Ignavibacteriaceae bacterium]